MDIIKNFINNLLNTPSKNYYFDNNATTCYIDPIVIEIINKYLTCGNPSNDLYSEGNNAKKINEHARKLIANDLMVNPEEIYFTANATESNNICVQSIVKYHLDLNERFSIMCSNSEHPSVLEIFKQYQHNPNINVIIIPIETNKNNKYYGSINPHTLIQYISNAPTKIVLMSIMYANNETGAINPIKAIGKICKKFNIIFHSDCTQAIGKFKIYPNELFIDAITFSGHKIHVPKGVGCLYLKERVYEYINPNIKNKKKLKCILNSNSLTGVCYGGEQTKLRPGTENVAFNIGLAVGLNIIHTNRLEKNKHLEYMKRYITHELKKIGCYIIEPSLSLCNTIMVIIKDIAGCNKLFVRKLSEEYNICVGISSACQTSQTRSHVAEAIKIPYEDQEKTLRISLCDYNTIDECKYLVNAIKNVKNEMSNRKNLIKY